jgi:hypothetical protein
MNDAELPPDPAAAANHRGARCRWFVCDPTETAGPEAARWTTATRRFLPEMVPEGIPIDVRAVKADRLVTMLRAKDRAIVFWTLRRDGFAGACERVARVRLSFPRTVQLAATGDLGQEDRIALLELGIQAFLRQPEEMPRVSQLATRHFSGAR